MKPLHGRTHNKVHDASTIKPRYGLEGPSATSGWGSTRSIRDYLQKNKDVISRRFPSTRFGGKPKRAHHDRFQSRRLRLEIPLETHVQDQSKVSPWVIRPRTNWKVRWDIWVGIIICYSVIFVPYRIGFNVDMQLWEQYMNYGFDASFGFDMVLNLFTGYYDGDVLLTEPRKIRARYFRTWFVFDLLSTLPLDAIMQAVDTVPSTNATYDPSAGTSSSDQSYYSLKLLRTIRLFRLFKLMRLLRLKRALEVLQMDALNAHVLQTLRILMMIIFAIHLMACAWYMFYTWDPTSLNWVTFYERNITGTDMTMPYLVSFYWVSNTIMSVGSGDIVGVTNNERLFTIFVEMFGSICVGLIIANIQMLTENYNQRVVKMKKKLQETKEFLIKRNIPRRIRQRVTSQFEYHWGHRSVFDEEGLLAQFPCSLQYELLAASMESFVVRFPFLGVSSVGFFIHVVPKLRPIVLGNGQTLVEAESVWEELYFLCTGTVESLRGNMIAGALQPGEICGIEYLVSTRKRYTHTYRASSKSELYALRSLELIKAIKKCPIAEKYLTDLSNIVRTRLADAARRGHRALQKQQTIRRNLNQNKSDTFLQYRHRMQPEMNQFRRFQIAITEDIKAHWMVIRHYSRFRIAWDILMGLMIMMTAVGVPFRISFDVKDTDFIFATDRLSDVLFFLDVILNFFTTFVDDTGMEVVDPKEIRRHYLRGSFFVDMISTVPFDYIIESLTNVEDTTNSYRSLKLIRTVKLVKLLRLVRLFKLFKLNIEWTTELDISQDSIRLLKLLAPAIMIAHYVGCFFYYMSSEHPPEDAWWGSAVMEDNSTLSKYVAAIYWATTTMATVGFGDIHPVNHSEQLFAIFVMIGGTTLFAYVVGTVIEIVANSKSLMNREHEMVQRMNAYIKERGVSKDFITACQEHLRYVDAEKTFYCERDLLDALSYSLRSELLLFLNSSILSKIRFFDKKPKWFLSIILPRLVPQYFLAGDLLIYHGNIVSGIFFLMNGVVIAKIPSKLMSPTPDQQQDMDAEADNVFLNAGFVDHDGTIAMLQEGEFFGYKEVLTNIKAAYNVFAAKPTGTYVLPREAFDEFRENYPQVMEDMKSLLMHSINKQQTIVHHWQKNNIIGLSQPEVELYLQKKSGTRRHSFLHANKDHGAEADAEASDDAPEQEPSISSSSPDQYQCDGQKPSMSNSVCEGMLNNHLKSSSGITVDHNDC
ncbi:TPA: hypothetical protein N0F65_001868 [Lagenidium giganteum]|uniref:Cyclic nucleotide-binding domain-containing protein n=1 Tax=Lagenidium giganteum TaxID=4803 RepID=A0AAV2YZ07_9STRA|nr:TPA: hypothetical protein N0F65_001868 [Lagenidium giganteum]